MYIVEGNIGVGKSTFLSLIKEQLPSLACTMEPVDNWANQAYGKSLLEQFYAAPERWAYTIETLAMICRSRDHLAAQARDPHHLMERSIYSGHYCFALNGKREGYFTKSEWDVYMQWVSFIFNDKCREPLGFIYLQADPDVCHARIAKRKRTGESMIPIDYLNKIHDCHEDFLVHKTDVIPALHNVPTLVLDANIDFVDNAPRMQAHAQQVAEFILTTSGRAPQAQTTPTATVIKTA